MYYREHELHLGRSLAGCGLGRGRVRDRGHTQHSWVKKRSGKNLNGKNHDDVGEKRIEWTAQSACMENIGDEDEKICGARKVRGHSL